MSGNGSGNGSGRKDLPEINVQARLCRGNRYYGVGDLITYHSAQWLVKGVYFGISRAGDRELYYILGATTQDAPEEVME